MADAKLTALSEDTAPTTDDLVYVVNDPAGTPGSRKVTLANLTKGLGGAWASWTPTLSGRFTNGDWTKNTVYTQIGKTVFFKLNLIATDATPMAGGTAEAIFSLPVTAANLTGSSFYHISTGGRILDSGTAAYLCVCELDSTTTARIRYIDTGAAASAAQVAITSTAPFTWTTNDEISVQGFYEAA